MNFIFTLLLFRPLLFFLDYFFDGFNILISILVIAFILYNIAFRKIINKFQWLVLITFSLIIVKGFLYNYNADTKTILSNVMSYILFIIIIYTFTNKKINIKLNQYGYKNKKNIKYQLIIIIIIIYIFMITKIGYSDAWGMNVFIGFAYSPHSFVYSLINIYLINEYLYNLYNYCNKFSYSIINVSLILFSLLSGARVPTFFLIGLMMVFIYFRSKKKIILVFIFIIGILVVLSMVDLTKIPFFEKFISALEKGSISSGRDDIYSVALISFFNGGFIEILTGNGPRFIYNVNLLAFGSDIQAHNDFINILVMGGIISLFIIIYTYYKLFISILRNNRVRGIIITIIIIVLAFFNGVITYPSIIYSFPFLISICSYLENNEIC